MVPFGGEHRGDERRFAVILSDVTRDKVTTEERIENERTSSILLLAAGVAHELGNPLNSLTIHLQLIERKLRKLKASRETEALGESIRICRDEVTRLDGIISNFLEAIRPRPPDLAETNLVEVLDEVLRFQQRELADRGITVEAETSAGLPLVMADRNQLKQVFFNITKNAVEAMQPGGRLRIRTRADDEQVYLLFGDTGSGIRQEDLVRLFQPYHTTKPGGHGCSSRARTAACACSSTDGPRHRPFASASELSRAVRHVLHRAGSVLRQVHRASGFFADIVHAPGCEHG